MVKVVSISFWFKKYVWLISSIALVLIIKIPHLVLPYFGDEAWSYYPAILKMAENGPGLLPGAIPLDSAKGHPLFFYFLASSWISVLGNKIISVRLFALSVSIITLLCFHYTLKKLTNKYIADISVILLSVQSMFLAQASLLLPEMLLTLLLIISLYFFMSGKFWFYCLAGSLMVLTKETGIAFICCFGLIFLFENLAKPNQSGMWKRLLPFFIPIVVYCLFLFLHFIRFGSFFFKEHLDFIAFKPVGILGKFTSSTSILFLRYGRNTMLFIALLSLAFLLLKKRRIEWLRLLTVTLFLIISLILFSIVNFYTYRYMLPAFPLFILLCATLLFQVRLKMKIVNYLVVSFLVITTLYYSLSKASNNDNDLGYAQYVPVYQQIVGYCEEQQWYDYNITGGFNMVLAMRNLKIGYLSTGKIFNIQHYNHIDEATIIILDSSCKDKNLDEYVKEKAILVKRFENKKHWGEIYRRINTDNSR